MNTKIQFFTYLKLFTVYSKNKQTQKSENQQFK